MNGDYVGYVCKPDHFWPSGCTTVCLTELFSDRALCCHLSSESVAPTDSPGVVSGEGDMTDKGSANITISVTRHVSHHFSICQTN